MSVAAGASASAALRLPLEVLACPACHASLALGDCRLSCAACLEQYPIAGGVPLLMAADDRRRFQTRLDETEGARMEGRYRARSSGTAWARLKRALRPPQPLVHNHAEPRLPCPVGSRNLWIGGGGRITPGFYNLDIGPFPGVDLVANAERLPFRDAVLDAVECDAVLEHVESPERLADEVLRVLKPGGLFHAVVPFCHPYHAYPADFRRWTESGFAHWMAAQGFETLQSGVRTGPTATILAFLLEYNKVMFGEGALGKAAWVAAGWLLFPLRYLDLWLNRRPQARLLANHVFVLARKRAATGGASINAIR